MTTYVISFRIADNSTYPDRYESTMQAIRREASNGTTWTETTSLVILRSDRAADSVASSIYTGSSFDVKTDTLLVVDAIGGHYATRGVIQYPATLDGMFAKNSLAGLFG